MSLSLPASPQPLHWYHPLGRTAVPIPRARLWYRYDGDDANTRTAASAIINGFNAIDYWLHGDNPTYLVGCMRVQISNLWELALQSDLPQEPTNNVKIAVVTLLKECRDALFAFNPLTPQGQSASAANSPAVPQSPSQLASQAFAQPVNFTSTTASGAGNVRTANTASHIESNTKAALGAMAYLQDPNLFGQQGQAIYSYIQYRLNQVIALMEGSVGLNDVIAERQRLVSQQQSSGQAQQSPPTILNSDGSMTPYMPSSGYSSVQPSTVPANYGTNSASSASTDGNAGSASNQSAPTSPLSGLSTQNADGRGATNTNENDEETVGRHDDWFSVYGTSLEQFAARCSAWMKQGGGNQIALVAHLRACGVPENVIVQVLRVGMQ